MTDNTIIRHTPSVSVSLHTRHNVVETLHVVGVHARGAVPSNKDILGGVSSAAVDYGNGFDCIK